MSITGYNLCHLEKFSRAELRVLASKTDKGLLWRMYGGEETRTFTLGPDLIWFLKEVEGRVVIVYVGQDIVAQAERLVDAGVFVEGYEFENERFLKIEEPVIWKDFWGWLRFIRNPLGFYRDIAKAHLREFDEFDRKVIGERPWVNRVFHNLPFKVLDNAKHRAYAEVFLQSSVFFEVDLHVYGDYPIVKVEASLAWYLNNANGRQVSLLEWLSLPNTRDEALALRNTDSHVWYHREALALFGEMGVKDVVAFTYAANPTVMAWQNQPFLAMYLVDKDGVYSTAPRVW